MKSDVERLAVLEVRVEEHDKVIVTMGKAVTDLSHSVTELVTTYRNKERNQMIIGGLVCSIIGSLPSILEFLTKIGHAGAAQ